MTRSDPSVKQKSQAGTIVRFLLAFLAIIITFLLLADRDNGQTLIHTVKIEITEDRFIRGRLARPLAAQSLDQRGGVLLLSKTSFDRHDEMASSNELTANGLVALTVDGFTQGDRNEFLAHPHPAMETTMTDLIVAATDLLRSQPFIRDDQVGVALIGFTPDEKRTLLETLEQENHNVTDTVFLSNSDSGSSEQLVAMFANKFNHDNPTIAPGATPFGRTVDRLRPWLIGVAYLTILGILLNIPQRIRIKPASPLQSAGSVKAPTLSHDIFILLMKIFMLILIAALTFYPEYLFPGRPRFLADRIVLNLSVAAVILDGINRFPRLKPVSNRVQHPFVSGYRPTVDEIKAVVYSLFFLSGSVFVLLVLADDPLRVYGVGFPTGTPGQLINFCVYLVPIFLFFNAVTISLTQPKLKQRQIAMLLVFLSAYFFGNLRALTSRNDIALALSFLIALPLTGKLYVFIHSRNHVNADDAIPSEITRILHIQHIIDLNLSVLIALLISSGIMILGV